MLFSLGLQKVIESIKMVPSCIKIGKEQLNTLSYGDDSINRKKLNRKKTTFCRNGKHCQKFRTTHKSRKSKIYVSGKEKQFKK
jgi:hypothetical protein